SGSADRRIVLCPRCRAGAIRNESGHDRGGVVERDLRERPAGSRGHGRCHGADAGWHVHCRHVHLHHARTTRRTTSMVKRISFSLALALAVALAAQPIEAAWNPRGDAAPTLPSPARRGGKVAV